MSLALHIERATLQGFACFYSACVTAALAHLHEEGYIHRNVTPHCVYVLDNGYAQLSDFTCAKKMDGDKVSCSDCSAGRLALCHPTTEYSAFPCCHYTFVLQIPHADKKPPGRKWQTVHVLTAPAMKAPVTMQPCHVHPAFEAYYRSSSPQSCRCARWLRATSSSLCYPNVHTCS